MRFLSDEEARESMEKELEQPAPQHILDILITARPIPGKEASEVPITTLEIRAVERSKEVAAETEDEEVSVTIQEHIERSKEVKEEPVMMIGERSWRCGDEGERLGGDDGGNDNPWPCQRLEEGRERGAHRARQGGDGGAHDDDWKGGQHGHRACKEVGERS